MKWKKTKREVQVQSQKFLCEAFFFPYSVYMKSAVMCLKCQYDIQLHTGLVELLLLAVPLAELL